MNTFINKYYFWKTNCEFYYIFGLNATALKHTISNWPEKVYYVFKEPSLVFKK